MFFVCFSRVFYLKEEDLASSVASLPYFSYKFHFRITFLSSDSSQTMKERKRSVVFAKKIPSLLAKKPCHVRFENADWLTLKVVT